MCASLILPSRLPPAAALPKKCTASCGAVRGRPTDTPHTLLAAGPTSTPCTFFLFSSSVFVLVLERLRGKQAARTFFMLIMMQEERGAEDDDGLRDVFQMM